MSGLASLQVLSQGTDCVVDLSQILDPNICPTIHVTTDKPRKVEDKDTYILITPTGNPNQGPNNGGNQGPGNGGQNGNNGGQPAPGGPNGDNGGFKGPDGNPGNNGGQPGNNGGQPGNNGGQPGNNGGQPGNNGGNPGNNGGQPGNNGEQPAKSEIPGNNGGQPGNNGGNPGNNGGQPGNNGGQPGNNGGQPGNNGGQPGNNGGQPGNNGGNPGNNGGNPGNNGGNPGNNGGNPGNNGGNPGNNGGNPGNNGGNPGNNGGNNGGNPGNNGGNNGGNPGNNGGNNGGNPGNNGGNNGGNPGNNGGNNGGNPGNNGGNPGNNGGNPGNNGGNPGNNGGNNGGNPGNNGGNNGGNPPCKDKTCYNPPDEVCDKSTVAFDLDLLVVLGLLTQEELEAYLKTRGLLPQERKLDVQKDKVKLESLLSIGLLTEDKVLEAKIGDGLIDLGIGGKDGLLNLNIGGKNGLIDVHLKKRDRFLDANILSETDHDNPNVEPAALNLDVLTYEKHHHQRRANNNNHLLDLDLLGEADRPGDEADIDIDIGTTQPHGSHRNHNGHRNHRRDGGLLDVDVGGYKDENPASIDVDILTKNRPAKSVQPENPTPGGDHIIYYQPLCKKTFKNDAQAEKVHAQDVNHCLALCNARAGDLTVKAGVKVGDHSHIQVCAAVVFDSSENNGDNCRYLVRPETSPVTAGDLVDHPKAIAFIQN